MAEDRFKLPAFEMKIEDFEQFVKCLQSNFTEADATPIRFTLIRRKMDDVAFDSIESLRAAEKLPHAVKRFHLKIGKSFDKNVYIFSEVGSGKPRFIVEGGRKAWRVGIHAAAKDFVQPYGRLKNIFWSIPFGWLLVVAAVPQWIPLLTRRPLTKWEATFLTFVSAVSLISYTLKSWFLASATISVSQRENFIRRYSTELIVFLTAIGAVATVLATIIATLAWLKK